MHEDRWERTPKHKLAICKWYFAKRPHGEGIVVCVDSKRTPNNYLKHNKPLNNAYQVMKKIVYSKICLWIYLGIYNLMKRGHPVVRNQAS